ncbi:uncharacterized protein TNIN_279872 [Trichonephila inaurata madagascariensis]|uniref:Uncharacterized protein n=1 Tax=Trichonephila inaurata madagascariensis TaxID=2747483 RepID=A0A8X6XBD2_9ARAC|nr:uncharacterized protein TNIN_279872 [Trichonephila inaurata madagascariensis]
MEIFVFNQKRHKNKAQKEVDSSLTSKRCHIQEIDDEYDQKCSNVTKLEDDLTELINLCNATDQFSNKINDEVPDMVKEEEESTDECNNDSDDETDEIVKQKNLNQKSVNGCCQNMSCT